MPDTDQARYEFAQTVINLAIASENNAELMAKLERRFGKDYCILCGEGTTRRVYAVPSLGLVLKLQREGWILDHPLTPAEIEFRCGWLGWLYCAAELVPARRIANLCEVGLALSRPLLLPKMYDFLGAFGITQSHPSVLVAEAVKPLTQMFPNDFTGVAKEYLGLDEVGQLHVFDPRVTSQKRPASFIPFESLLTNPDTTGVWLGNIGIASNGRYVFCDGAGFATLRSGELLNESTFTPKEWGLTERGTPEQTLNFSHRIFTEYQNSLQEAIRNATR